MDGCVMTFKRAKKNVLIRSRERMTWDYYYYWLLISGGELYYSFCLRNTYITPRVHVFVFDYSDYTVLCHSARSEVETGIVVIIKMTNYPLCS